MRDVTFHTVFKGLITGIIFLTVSCQGRDRGNVQQGSDNSEVPEPLQYDIVSDSYRSTTFGGINRNLRICLPSDYDTISQDLPVLYLFHGSSGNEETWIASGQLRSRMSTAYRNGRIGPMVVVLPFCDPAGSNYMGVGPEGDLFVREVVDELIPFIEENYNVSSERQNRAVGGNSAGGMQALNLALFYPELFDYVYPMGACFYQDALDVFASGRYDKLLKNPEINNIRVFSITMGLQDPRFGQFQKTLQFLDSYGIQYNYWESEGGHDWAFWITNLEYMLVELFRI